MALDRIDYAIIGRLLLDGRVSYLKLAKELKVPDTTIHFRVKRLQALGVLKKFTAVVDPREVGLGDIAFVKLKIESLVMPHLTRDRLDEIAEEFVKLDEVKFVAVSVDSAELIAVIATNDRQRTNEIVKRMQKSGGVEKIDVARLTDILKGHLSL